MFPFSIAGEVSASRLTLIRAESAILGICQDLRTQRITYEVKENAITLKNPYVLVLPFARYTIVSKGLFRVHQERIEYQFSTLAFCLTLSVVALIFASLALAITRSVNVFALAFLFAWGIAAGAHFVMLMIRNGRFLDGLVRTNFQSNLA